MVHPPTNVFIPRANALAFVIVFALALVAGVCGGCSRQSDVSMRNKLQAILAADLAAVLDSLPQQSRSDSVYFSLTDYKTFPDGKYRAKAEAEFHFLRNVDAVVLRKYRYDFMRGMWDRYYNEYRLASTPAVGKGNDSLASSSGRP